jgi:hypothetical protein
MFQVRRAKERHQSARSGMLRRRERRGGRTWQQWRTLVMVRVAKVRRETDISCECVNKTCCEAEGGLRRRRFWRDQKLWGMGRGKGETYEEEGPRDLEVVVAEVVHEVEHDGWYDERGEEGEKAD